MANDASGNPWRLDEAGVISTERHKIVGIRWVGATTAGHVCVLKDASGKYIWESVAAGANYVEADTIHVQREYKGITLVTLESGVLYVEF